MRNHVKKGQQNSNKRKIILNDMKNVNEVPTADESRGLTKPNFGWGSAIFSSNLGPIIPHISEKIQTLILLK